MTRFAGLGTVRVFLRDTEIVRELIRREFGVTLSAVSVGRLLGTIGLSPQRPLFRAYQQDPEAVERWKTQDYPAIRAEAKKTRRHDLLRRRGSLWDSKSRPPTLSSGFMRPVRAR
jgi:hypothetical protein